MIENSKNKQVGKPQKQLYHFSGSGKYFPLAIQAASLEDAQKSWKKHRIPYKK